MAQPAEGTPGAARPVVKALVRIRPAGNVPAAARGRLHLYGHPASGNVYKPMLLMGLLGIDYDQTPIKWKTDVTRTPEYRRLNPEGRVPTLVDRRATAPRDPFVLPESDAILWYLSQGTPYWPTDPAEQAQVLRWLFWEQYSHEPTIAVIRFWRHTGPAGAETERKIAEKTPGAKHALDVLEAHLSSRHWMVGDAPSIADVALYAYTHVAHEAGLPLDERPALRAWCARIKALDGYVPMAPYASAE